jgi:hypothetical protein
MLLRCAREIRSACKRGTACPDEVLSARDVGCEELVLEVAGVEPDACRQARNFTRLRDIARQWFFTSDTSKLRAGFDGPNNFLDVFDSRVVGAA